MINKAFAYLNNDIEETNSFCKITINHDDFDLNQINLDNIFCFIKEIPSRDKYEFSLEIDGTIESITNIEDKTLLIKHLNKYKSENEKMDCIIILEITKHLIDSTLSIYSINDFMNFLENKKLNANIELFSKILKNNIIFDVFDDSFENSLFTNSIAFIKNSLNKEHSFSNDNRNDKIKLLHENSTVTNIKCELLNADDFHIISGINIRISELFKKIKFLLSFSAIVNNFQLNDDDSFNIKINGYKTIINDNLLITSFNDKNDLLYNIYKWAYEGGNGSDKIGLIRNVLSLHLDDCDNVTIDLEVWNAIHSNYQIYLKENIQSYLEVKNKIGEFILELSAKTYSISDDILNTFKNNILLLLTFIISVVIVNGIKDNGIEKIFSQEYMYVVFFLSFISIIWFYLLQHESIKRFDKATSSIRDILVRNYQRIIMESEIDNTINPVLTTNKMYLKSQIKIFWIYLVTAIIIINIFFIVGYKIKNNTESVNTIGTQSISVLLKNEKKHINQLNMLNYNVSEKLINEINKINSDNNELVKERNNYHNKLKQLEEENLKLQNIYGLDCNMDKSNNLK